MVLPLRFNTLSQADQAELLQMEGIFEKTIADGDVVIDRYLLHDFIVDIYYYSFSEIYIHSYYPAHAQPPVYQMHLPQLLVKKGA